jgi:hypothetical protein
MDRHGFAALQLNAVKLQRQLGILARLARLRGDHMAHQFRSLGNLGSVRSLYRRLGLNYHAIAILGGLGVELVH